MNLKGSRFAGYSDWRLPTIEELRSLVYCSNGIPASEAWVSYCDGKDDRGGKYVLPTIQREFFPNTKEDLYWSSSPYANYSGSARFVTFGGGRDSVLNKSFNQYVRLVRGGQ